MSNIAKASSSTYIITGYVERHGTKSNGVENPPPVNCGIFICIDGSGNVLWSYKFIDKYSLAQDGPNVNCVKALQLQNGTYILYLQELTSSINSNADSKIFCLSASGVLQWKVNLHFPNFIYNAYTGNIGMQMKELRNGSIVIADNLYREHTTEPEKEGLLLHLFSLNSADGNIIWEKSFETPLQFGTGRVYSNIWMIENICELPSGDLSVICYTFSVGDGSYPLQSNTINIITDNTGNIRKTIAYTLSDYYVYPIKATTQSASGRQTLMCTTPQTRAGENTDVYSISYEHPVIVTIDETGHIISQKRYDPILSTSENYAAVNDFTNRYPGGFSLFYSEYANHSQSDRFVGSKTILTDDAGTIDCAQSDASVTEKEIDWYRRENTGFLRVDAPENYIIYILPLTLQNNLFLYPKQ